ncbi:XdhC family protein [Atopobiaceae bacterium 24-176]
MADLTDTLRDPRFVEAVARSFAQGKPCVLAVVLSCRGSMPRDASAAMALVDGEFLGTVGGGKVEAMVQERCLAAAHDEGPADDLTWYTHAMTGMACGGDALVGIHRLTASDAVFLDRLLDALDEGRPRWLTAVWPEEGPASFSVADAAPEVFGPRVLGANDTCWYPEARTYVESPVDEPVVYIFGAGHVSAALVPALSAVGFVCEVADDRPELAVRQRFPEARCVRSGDFAEVARKLPVTDRDYVVVMTHGHTADLDVLKATMDRHPSYVGCIGSRSKRRLFDAELEAAGIPAGEVAALHLPIGDDIGAVTPAEIAVSVAAEMVRHRAGGPHHRD